MTKPEILKLIRNIAYKWHIDEAERVLYKIINGKPYPEEKAEPKTKTEKSRAFGVMKDASIRDGNGELIHFPSDGRPYYDRSLQKTFNTKRDKRDYLKEKNLVMDGSNDKPHMPLEAGDARNARVR